MYAGKEGILEKKPRKFKSICTRKHGFRVDQFDLAGIIPHEECLNMRVKRTGLSLIYFHYPSIKVPFDYIIFLLVRPFLPPDTKNPAENVLDTAFHRNTNNMLIKTYSGSAVDS